MVKLVSKKDFFLIFIFFSKLLFAIEFEQQDAYILTLKPFNSKLKKLDNKHVIQGLASFRNKWIVSQTIKNKHILINILDSKGNSIYNNLIDFPSHAVDLSIDISRKHNLLYIYTQGKHRNGIVKFSTKINKFNLKLNKSFSFGLSSVIPTISEDKNYFLVKSKDTIYIYRYIDIEKNIKPRAIFSFLLAKEQRKKGQWFQGIALKDGIIYCLTGDNTLDGGKCLYIYDAYGRVITKYILQTGRKFAKSIGDKWELEGLSFRDNKLYTVVIGRRKKEHEMKLYQILSIKTDHKIKFKFINYNRE